MTEIPASPSEPARLAALRRHAVLDSGDEPEFDDVVRVAAALLDAPMAALGFLDADRLWLKARVGLEVEELPRTSALGRAALERSARIVSDAGAGDRWRGEPLLAAPAGVRSWVAEPITSREGLVLGVLAVMDRVSRSYPAARLGSLSALARHVAALLELRRWRRKGRSAGVSPPTTGEFLQVSAPLVEAARHAVIEAGVTFDGSGRIVEFGPPAQALFALDAGEALGSPAELLLCEADDRDRAVFLRALREPPEGLRGPFPVRARRGDRTEFAAEITLLPAIRGDGAPVPVHVRDVSGRRLIEQALRESALAGLTGEPLLTSTPYPAEVCEAAVRTLRVMPEVDHCSLFLLDAGRRRLKLAFWSGDPPRLPHTDLAIDGPAIAARVARQGDRALTRGRRRSAAEPEAIAEAAFPLVAAGEVVGVLQLESRSPHALSPALLSLCDSVASGVAAALQGTNITEIVLRAKVALERLFDAMPELIAILDTSGRIRRLNQAMAARLGRPPRELVGESFEDLFPFCRDWLLQSADGPAPDEPAWIELRDPDSEVIYDVSLLRLEAPSPLFGDRVAFMRDVTRERDLAERMLAAERRAAVGDLLTGVAHEVRNPLAAIQAAVQGLQRETSSPDDAALLGVIDRQVDRLGSLMQNLLYIGKPFENVALERHSLRRLCQEAVELWRQASPNPERPVEVRLAGEDAFEVPADPARVEQVLLNLLDNADQHSPARLPVTIALSREGDEVRVSVTDAGPGLAPEVSERLFEPFFTTRENGTGLGLALVKSIVEGHGGSVSARNNDPDPGCTVEVRLPGAARG